MRLLTWVSTSSTANRRAWISSSWGSTTTSRTRGSARRACSFNAGRALRARREFAKAVQIDPASDYAHFALALACERTGQRSRAIGHLKLAIAMRPGVDDYERALARLAG